MDALDRALQQVAAQRSEEWRDIRAGRFTASEIWKLLVQPKTKSNKISQTALDYISLKVAETLTGHAKQSSYAYPLVYGEEMEPQAIEYFVEITGHKYEVATFVPFSTFAGGSPDGYVNDDAILEIKCPYESENQIAYLLLNGAYDLKKQYRAYYWQCQANMLFTKRNLCYFATYDPRFQETKHKMKIIPIEADSEAQRAILDALEMAQFTKLELMQQLP